MENVLLAVHLGQEGAPRDHMDRGAFGAEAAEESGRGYGYRRLRRWVILLFHKLFSFRIYYHFFFCFCSSMLGPHT